MDILWSAIGIAAIVCFVFYVLASHWRGILRHQSWTIRQLAERVRTIEEVSDPEFRRRLGESAPVPLEQVFNFSFRLDERFWQEHLRILKEDWDFIRASGRFVGALKIERWRSHTVATVTEVLSENDTARWQTRSLDFYPDATRGYDSLMLWELALTTPNGSPERRSALELILRRDAIEMWGPRTASVANGNGTGPRHGNDPDDDLNRFSWDKTLHFRVPLDSGLLTEFRSKDPAITPESENGRFDIREGSAGLLHERSWRAYYSHRDEDRGIEWQLRLRDLNKKAEWERWNILDGTASPVTDHTDQEPFIPRWRAHG